MRKIAILFVFMFACIFSSGCEQIDNLVSKFTSPDTKPIKGTTAKREKKEFKPEVKGTELAKVNEHVVTLEEFQENVKNLQALSEEIKLDTFETKKELLTELVNQELLYQEAKSRGIERREEVKKAVENYLRGTMVQQLILDATENVTIEAQEIESFYNEYRDQFSEPEERRVREIVVGSEQDAKLILISLLQGADFASIAREKSISSSRNKGGDLGFLKRGDKFSKFDEIAFSVDRGEASSVFKGLDGYYIVKVEQIKEGKARLLTEVWDPIKETLLALKKQQKLQDLTEKLRQDAKITINDELIKF